MSTQSPGPVTELLGAVARGDAAAQEQLWAAIYAELHRVARNLLANQPPGRTLQPTMLVHEAYLRLLGDGDVHWANRRHFFAAAARVMRCIRIDDARRRGRLKRGGAGGAGTEARRHEGTERGVRPAGVPVEEVAVFDQDPAEVLAIDEALKKLEELAPRRAEIVTMRYFAGLTRDATAEAMGVSPRLVDKEWRSARAWLHRELS